MVTRAALEEQLENVLVNDWTEACCPANHLELVSIADSMHVAACIQERANHFNSAGTACEMQRVRIVADISRIYIGAMLEQESNSIQVLHCLMQSSRPVWRAFANQRRLPLEELA